MVVVVTAFMAALIFITQMSRKKILRMNRKLIISEGSFKIALSHMACLVFEYDVFTDSATFLNSFFNIRAGSRIEGVSTLLKDSGSIHSEDITIYNMIKDAAARGNSVPPTGVRLKIQDKDKDFRWYRLAVTNLVPGERTSVMAVGTLDDIAEFKSSEIKLRREEQYRRAIMSQTIQNYEFNLTRDEKIGCHGILNEAWCDDMPKYSEIVDYTCENMIYFDDVEMVRAVLDRGKLLSQFEQGITEYSVEYRRAMEQTYIWVRCNIRLIRDPFTQDVVAICYIDDIDKDKQNEIVLRKKAETDYLTGLLNRGAAERSINAYLENSRENSINALLVIDLDGFKLLNDTYGHLQGDKLLSNIGVQMKRVFRTSDIIGRIGGDEFTVFMKDVASEAVVSQKAEQLIHVMNQLRIGGDEGHPVSCSIGICYSDSFSKFEELYANGDNALYRAKAMGKGIYVTYEPPMACEG